MLVSRLLCRVAPALSRSATTSAKGLQGILQKSPDDVVITFAQRTALGRAKKGQFKDVPVDEILNALFKVYSSLFFTLVALISLFRLRSRRPNWIRPKLMIFSLVTQLLRCTEHISLFDTRRYMSSPISPVYLSFRRSCCGISARRSHSNRESVVLLGTHGNQGHRSFYSVWGNISGISCRR